MNVGLSLLLALMTLVLPMTGTAEPGMYALYDGEQPLGTAVHLGEAEYSLLFTTVPFDLREDLRIYGGAGEIEIEMYNTIGDVGVMYGEELSHSSGLWAVDWDARDTLRVCGLNASGEWISGEASRAAAAGGIFTLTGPEGLLPGAAVINQEGDCVGLITESLSEGRGRYRGLTLGSILDDLYGDTTEPTWISGFAAFWEAGYIEMVWPYTAKGGQVVYTVYVFDEGNPAGQQIDVDEIYCLTALPAGRSAKVAVCLRPADSEAPTMEEAMAHAVRVKAPEMKAMDRFSYRDSECTLCAAPAEQEVANEDHLTEAQDTSLQALRDESLRWYLQVTSHYEVGEGVEESLIAALYTPDGAAYAILGGFYYGPDIMLEDIWNMEITQAIREADAAGSLIPGEYRLIYCLDGDLANEVTFTAE